jgi:hypothetical protein
VPVPELHVTPWLAATATLDREVAPLLVKDTVVVAGALPELHTLPPVPVSVTGVGAVLTSVVVLVAVATLVCPHVSYCVAVRATWVLAGQEPGVVGVQRAW